MDLGEETARSPLVILLDHASASALARDAPHTVSWAGGIWLPPDHPVRGVQTAEELAQGERALREALAKEPDFARAHAGQEVAVDLRSQRLFIREGTATALDVAKAMEGQAIAVPSTLKPPVPPGREGPEPCHGRRLPRCRARSGG